MRELEGFDAAPIAERHRMKWRIEVSARRSRMAIFVCPHDHCLVDLLYRRRSGELYGVPFHCVPAGNDKEPAEAVLSAGFAGKYGDRISNRSLEKLVLSRAIRRHTGHRILVYGNRAVVFD